MIQMDLIISGRHAVLEGYSSSSLPVLLSPEMDIVMLHFIYDPFIPLLDKGIQPQVIMNHESVANHYYVSSINLAEEVAQRMRDGEFDWKEFGGTHPAWNGHTVGYAAADQPSPPPSREWRCSKETVPGTRGAGKTDIFLFL